MGAISTSSPPSIGRYIGSAVMALMTIVTAGRQFEVEKKTPTVAIQQEQVFQVGSTSGNTLTVDGLANVTASGTLATQANKSCALLKTTASGAIICADGESFSESSSDERYVQIAGDTMTGNLKVQATISGTVLHADDTLTTSGKLIVGEQFILNTGSSGTLHAMTINPTTAVPTDGIFHGIHIEGGNLDPAGAGADVVGIEIDYSGVDMTNNPTLHAVELTVPVRTDAIHIHEGQVVINNAPDNTAATEFAGIDIRVDSANLASTSAWGGIHFTNVGSSNGMLDALIVRTGLSVFRQEVGTFVEPSQTEFAGEKTSGGTSWSDGLDGNAVFAVVDDEIWIGSNAQFSQIEFVLSAGATKDLTLKFYYSTGSSSETEFFPDDETSGFQTSQVVSWPPSSISALWTNTGDPGGADTTAGYWIRIERNRNGNVGTPAITTAKIAAITTHGWNKEANAYANAFSGATITSTGKMHAATELTSSGTLIIEGAATFNDTITGSTLEMSVSISGAILTGDPEFRAMGAELTVTGTLLTVGSGKVVFLVGADYNGYNFIGIEGTVHNPGITASTKLQVRRCRGATCVHMLSTAAEIETTEYNTFESAEDGVVNTSNDDVLAGDRLVVDIPLISTGTAPNGLSVNLRFQKP